MKQEDTIKCDQIEKLKKKDAITGCKVEVKWLCKQASIVQW